MSGESIKVCCRFRKEMTGDDSEFDDWEFDEDSAEIKLRDKKWTYDYILNHLTEQDEMYEKVGKQTITDFMNGFNGTIFAYGQSGSGKTFSMLGPEDVTDALSKDFNSVPESVTQLYGITPRAVIQMFETINNFVSQGSSCTLIASYIEIYNETIKCLLSKKENLKIREQPGMGMNVADKEIRICKTPEEIFEVISCATKNRAVTGTNQNARSSRSHTILLIEFEYNGVDGVKRNSRLNLVDLAGSERISKTGCEGQSLKEAQKINQSLTTLGMCIMALTTAGSKHIPFRNSKLTLILKESLGGNSKTTLLCTASRRKIHNEESVQTLYFASRAKAIKNNCKSNVQMGVKELQYLAEHMKKEVLTLRGQLKKGGLNYSLISDPKLLAFISNDEYEGGEGESGHDNSHVDLDREDPRKRRVSLVNLTEKDIIIKYCELRAKYDNLLESAGNTIYKLNNQQNLRQSTSEFNSLRAETDEKLQEIVDSKNQEINALLEKIDNEKREHEKREDELNQKFQDMLAQKLKADEAADSARKEYDSLQEMFSLTQNDIAFFQEKLAKKKTKNQGLKEQISGLKAELSGKNETVDELNKKISESESKNLESKQKVDELTNKNELLLLEIEKLKNLLNQKEESENFQINRNKELQEELNKQSETLRESEKKFNELSNKFSETELKFKNETESFANRDSFNLSQIESLKKENENLQRLVQDKISDQELLAEKEKMLSESKSVLDKRIDDLVNENEKLKTEMLEFTTKVNAEKSELSMQIDALNREIKTKQSEFEAKQFEFDNLKKSEEEKFKLEVQKSEQLQSRIDAADKKVYELEATILSLQDSENKLTQDKQTLERELKEKNTALEGEKQSVEKYVSLSEKYEKEAKDLKENLNEAKNKLKEELEVERKRLLNEQTLYLNEIETKNKKIADEEKKINEIRAEVKVLQDLNQRLQKRVSELELDNHRTKKVSVILEKEVNVIKEKTPLNKNIFGVLLKKTDNKILKEAREETKKIEKNAENIYQDKLAELRGLRENIINLSPKTVSSRSDIEDMPEIDFQDEESFKKAEMLLLEKEKLHQEEKLKKEAEELLKKDKGMIV